MILKIIFGGKIILKKPIPIFIVGVQRTGTTWIANIISNNSNVTACGAEKHKGIHESAFFSKLLGYCGDLKDNNKFIEFVSIFSKSDYFFNQWS